MHHSMVSASKGVKVRNIGLFLLTKMLWQLIDKPHTPRKRPPKNCDNSQVGIIHADEVNLQHTTMHAVGLGVDTFSGVAVQVS